MSACIYLQPTTTSIPRVEKTHEMSDNTDTFEIPNTFELHEYPDVNTLETIWRNEMIIPHDQLRLYNYMKRVYEGCVHVTYERKTYNKVRYGRYFPRNGQVLWAAYQWRAIRAALFGKGHLDVDIVNCHPTLAAQLYTQLTGRVAVAVEEYIKNRDEIINQTHISSDAIARYNKRAQDCLTKKDFVKYLFTLTLYGGAVGTWAKHFGLEPGEYELPPLYERFAKEVARIRAAVANTDDPYYVEMRKNVTAAKGKLEPHKFLSLVLQDLEAHIVYAMIQQAEKDGYEVTSYMYDGFIIKADNLPPEYLKRLEKVAYERCWGFRVKLTVKPFDWSIDLTRLSLPSVYLDDGYDYDLVDRINYANLDKFIRSVFALIRCGGKSYWIAKCVDKETRNITYQRIKTNSNEETNFKNIIFKDSDGKEFTLLDRLRDLKPVLSYSKEDFRPYLKYTPNDIFNMFTGFKHAFRAGEPTPRGLEGLEAFKKHILEVWAARNNKNAAYIFGWLAHIIQRPSKRIGTALLLKSHPGAGKNVITDFLAEYVIGDKYYFYTGDIDDMFTRFNSDLAHKLLTVIDETSTSELKRRKITDRLKSLITRKVMNVEHKGVDRTRICDYNNYIFLTNRDDAIPVEGRDRRLAIFECSNHLCGRRREYFKPLVEKLYNDEAGYAVFKWLAEYDLSEFDPEEDLPKTELKNNMKIENLSFSARMIIEALRGDYEVDWHIDDNGKVCMPTNWLYDHYRNWCARKGANPYNEFEFGRRMNEILKTTRKTITGKKYNGWFNVTLDELKKAACNYMKNDDLFAEEQPGAEEPAGNDSDDDL